MKSKLTKQFLFFSICLLLVFAGSAQNLVPVPNVPGMSIEEGYELKLSINGLNFPSNITQGDDRLWITEAGFPQIPPTVKEITLDENGNGTASTILSPAMVPMGTLMGPFTDLTYWNGMIWLSHRQMGVNGWIVGAYSKFSPDDPAGTFETVLTNLPSTGDHSNNTIVFSEGGIGYISIGSGTNSGVVGPDNVPRWVEDAPEFREYPPVDVTFAPNGFTSRVPTSLDPDSNAVTAAYRPFDTGAETENYVVAGASPATPQDGIIAGTGTVYSFDPMDSDPMSTLTVEAWGLRNAFGLAFDATDPDRLFISNNGSDMRGKAGDPSDPLNPEKYILTGNRPIAGDYDDMFEIEVGGEVEFFGWPDYFHDPVTNEVKSVEDDAFCDSPLLSEEDCPEHLLEEEFRNSLEVKEAFATVGPFVSVTGFSASTSEDFGYENNLFVTESGSFAPQTGTFEFTGYKVARYDHITGEKFDFLVNEGTTADEKLAEGKVNKPLSTIFVGDRMLVVDLGILEPGINVFRPGTGKIWMVSRTDTTTSNSTARVQLIHNSPRENVDVYANGELLLDNFVFRTATPYIDVPAGVEIDFAVAPANSSSASDAVANFAVTFEADETYVAVATGIVGGTPGFDLAVSAQAMERADSDQNIGVLFYHGTPDAPTIDIVSDGDVVFDDVSYGEFSDYINIPAAFYNFDVTPADDNDNLLARYNKDLSFWKGRTMVIFASGFLSGDRPAFEPWVALSNGGTFPLNEREPSPNVRPDVPNSDALALQGFSIYPNPTSGQLNLQMALLHPTQVEVRIFALTGKLLLTKNLGNLDEGYYQQEINVEHLTAGQYILQVSNSEELITRKLIISN